MKIKTRISRMMVLFGIVALMASCTTAYDAYGRPVQVVDPGVAVAAVAATGAAAYLIGRNNSHHGHYAHRPPVAVHRGHGHRH